MKDAAQSAIDLMGKVDPSASFEVRFWDDDRIRVGDEEPEFVLWFKTRNALARTFGDGFLGFGESYMDEEIEVEGDFRKLFVLGHQMDFGEHSLTLPEKIRFALLFLRNQNTFGGSRRNVAHAYNLGNDFYRLFLDENMAYTCAYFHTPDDSLEQAQLNKFDHVCRKLQLAPGERLVDVGCGWGGLLIHAAQHYGITGVGATLSEPQAAFANERIRSLGLQDRIRVLHQDYREVQGRFDKLSSIGMLEHVGKKFIPTCVKQISELLEPGGLGLLHSIGNDTPYEDDPWTMKYMFPGSHVPALEQVVHDLASYKQSILDIENLRPHYALTIDHWLERFESHFDEICERFDRRFARQWRLYWLVSTTSFSHGGNRLFQILFSNGLNNDLPLTRDHIYRDTRA
ncbi:SAM-dependent methyltransferase [Imhoffiella purpurea]|uniref:Cyclopropane-fatty-acyl-phospholipid synthase n=1 Tax=Imhoffiella purpurea TaxID=1249627 RepID=W9VAW6_9GAMM|nr:cyclopropane-fatty-acyl-phospholipid synthase family protein [Imhoffiella purpurea]EXJ13192.1 Cyclopropane-fatty-acyl-phospholipid synthase [Imhoffiella purpurea]